MLKDMSKVNFNTVLFNWNMLNKTACQQLLTKLCKCTLCNRSRIFSIFTCRMEQCFIGLRAKKHMLHGNIVNSFCVKMTSRIIACLKARDASKMGRNAFDGQVPLPKM